VTAPILPGAALGVFGAGQLGRMFAIAARRLGYRVHVLTDKEDAPAVAVADIAIQADFDSESDVADFARDVAAITFEFENVSAAAAEVAARFVPVRPAGSVLHTTQNRLREKSFLRDLGIPVTAFTAVRSATELAAAMQRCGTPAILKTAQWGYDGKGQMPVAAGDDAAAAWGRFGADEAIYERRVDFEREISVVAVRGQDGAFAAYEPIENLHRNAILDVSSSPALLPAGLASQALEMARTILESLGVVGVLCVEFFVDRDGGLLVNELAPRPHNSGHLTIDAHVCDQFEQQVRAICGLPLGSTQTRTPAAMANLLGDLWERGTPDWPRVLALPDVKLHLYGKREPRPGRKMGHLTALAATSHEARARVLAARSALAPTTPASAR
jgi:5-(carboxyamino)imidazole ribonucleotide synthase